jgi:serine/threonine-protein kinase RsbW
MHVEGMFRGRLAEFAEVRALAEAFGAALGLEHTVTLKVTLVLEELFTNTVTHGYPPGAEGPVWVTLAALAGAVEVLYEDAGPAFDPLTHPPAPPESRLIGEDPPVGGLGVALVLGLCTSACYARVADRNRVTLTVSTDSAPRA